MYKTLTENGVKSKRYGAIEIVNLLKDPEWKGVDGEGSHDLVLFIGVTYYLASQGLSSLKHFAPHLKTLTLCKFFHSNADASFPNMSDSEWIKYLEKTSKI
jgi:acetyl-CoA decarbonylase/synthase complex subunit epsilon